MNNILEEYDIDLLELDIMLDSGRIYPTEEVEKALNDPIIKERLNTKSFVGTLDCFFDSNGEFDMRNASHITSDLFIKDGWLKAHIQVLNTEQGKILKNYRSQVRYSIFGTGNVYDDKVTNYKIVNIAAWIGDAEEDDLPN